MKYTIALAVLLFGSAAFGQTVVQDNWLGGTGDWNNPVMWSAGVVPSNSEDGTVVYNVTIASGQADTVNMQDWGYEINSLSIGLAKGSLSAIEDVCGLTVNGTLTINKRGKLTGTYLTVVGLTTIAGALSGNFDKFGDIVNSGTIGTTADMSAGNFTNSGTFNISGKYGSVSVASVTQTAGKIQLLSWSNQLALTGSSTISMTGGELKGCGTVYGNVTISGGATMIDTECKEYDTDAGCGPAPGYCWKTLEIVGTVTQN